MKLPKSAEVCGIIYSFLKKLFQVFLPFGAEFDEWKCVAASGTNRNGKIAVHSRENEPLQRRTTRHTLPHFHRTDFLSSSSSNS